MFKKALIATASVVALSAPAFAGSLGNIQGTTSTTITGGTRAITINGSYASEEHTVGAATEGTGSSASATFSSNTGIATLNTTGTGGASTNTASATYSTNAVTAATYLNDQQHSYTGTESTTSAGVFFNY